MRGPVSYYDPDEIEPMVTAAVMYQAHRSQAQIARHLGVSRPTVSRLLARAASSASSGSRSSPRPPTRGWARTSRSGSGSAASTSPPGWPTPTTPRRCWLAGSTTRSPASASTPVTCSSSVGAGPSTAWAATKPPPARGGGRAGAGRRRRRPALVPGERDHQALGGDPPRHPRYLHAPAFVSSALKRSLVHEEGVHSTLDLWDRAKVALVGIGAYPKPDSSLVAVGFSDGDPAIADATGDVVGRFFTDDGTLIHYPDEPRLLAITPDRMRRIPHVVGISVGADKARAIVGAARARRSTPWSLTPGRPARWPPCSTHRALDHGRPPAAVACISMPPRHGSGSSAVASPSSPPMEPTESREPGSDRHRPDGRSHGCSRPGVAGEGAYRPDAIGGTG